MSISIDDLNATHVPADVFSDRWVFQLAEEFRGPHAGVMFDAGRSVEPIDFRIMRKFVVNYGRSMIGAMRVVGEPAELGDCSALRAQLGLPETASETPETAPEAAPETEPAESADQTDEPAQTGTPSQRPPAKGNRR